MTTIDTGQSARIAEDGATHTVTLVHPDGSERQVARVPSLDLARQIARHVAPVVYESGPTAPRVGHVAIRYAIS